MGDGSTSPADAQPVTAPGRILPKLPSVDFATLSAAVAVSVFLWTLLFSAQQALTSRVETLADRMGGIPTKSELGGAIEQAALIQRGQWEANATRVEASAREMSVTAENIRGQILLLEANNRQVTSMLNERLNMLDARIANLGIDYSGALLEYFRTGRAGQVVGGDGRGGSEGAEEVYRDYAVRLVVRDAGMSVTEAIAFVDRAFLHMGGAEAERLAELASSARSRNAGLTND